MLDKKKPLMARTLGKLKTASLAACGCRDLRSAHPHLCDLHAASVAMAAAQSSTTPEMKDSCTTGSCHNHSHDHHDHDDTSSNSSPDLSTPLAGTQRYSWQVTGMDCPSCARKIENAVTAIAGVDRASIAFATEKLFIDAHRDVQADVEKAVIAAGFTLRNLQNQANQNRNSAGEPSISWLRTYRPLIVLAALLLLSTLINTFYPQWGDLAFDATALVGLWPVARQAWRLAHSGTPFAIETLMSVAVIGALLIGASAEAASVLVLFMLGERLEGYAAWRARRGVQSLMALVPETAVLIRDDVRSDVAVSSLQPGDVIEVAPGGRLPADSILLNAYASFDESALTGESVPVEHHQGDKIAAGSLVVDSVVQLQVESEQGHSAIDRILHLIEEADERRAPIERFIDRFSRIYTPVIMVFSALVMVTPPLMMGGAWDEWIYRGLTLLLIGCPCALVISTPAAVTSALATATRHGALIKGGAALEQLGGIQTIAFDKTGTLTEGKPTVTDLLSVEGVSRERLLTLSASVEQGSAHPLAIAIVSYAERRNVAQVKAMDRRARAGVGVEGIVDGVHVAVSAPGKLQPGVLDEHWAQAVTSLEQQGKTVVAVLLQDKLCGLLALRDTLRADAREAIDDLRALGINSVMLTGDNPHAAAAIAAELGIDFRASLLPQDKLDAVSELNQQSPVAMLGDGINDAPAMKSASIGIAMGGGTDVALETADAALTHNRLTGVAQMIRLSRAAHANIRQNITLALGLKLLFLITSLLGFTGLWLAILADTGATALVTANALRLLKKR